MSSRAFAPARQLTARHWTPGERLDGEADAAVPEAPSGAPLVGVLALQGGVLEHLRALRRVGARATEIRTRDQLDAVDAVIVPGGESTTIGRLLETFDLADPLRARIRAGTPVFGTCAGMILLAAELDQHMPQPTLGVLDVRVRRNAFGRQRESFDIRLDVPSLGDPPIDVSFIRAPVITDLLADDVEVLAAVHDGPTPASAHDGPTPAPAHGESDGPTHAPSDRSVGGRVAGPVLVRQGDVWAAAFHAELTGDDRLHAAFVASLV